MQATVAVFGPVPWLTVTVGRDPSVADENHFHAGGQAVWVARAVHRLGETVAVCTALGGESGAVVDALVRREGLQVHAVWAAAPTASYLHDRRLGQRELIAAMAP